jgi:hypothetical protein
MLPFGIEPEIFGMTFIAMKHLSKMYLISRSSRWRRGDPRNGTFTRNAPGFPTRRLGGSPGVSGHNSRQSGLGNSPATRDL